MGDNNKETGPEKTETTGQPLVHQPVAKPAGSSNGSESSGGKAPETGASVDKKADPARDEAVTNTEKGSSADKCGEKKGIDPARTEIATTTGGSSAASRNVSMKKKSQKKRAVDKTAVDKTGGGQRGGDQAKIGAKPRELPQILSKLRDFSHAELGPDFRHPSKEEFEKAIPKEVGENDQAYGDRLSRMQTVAYAFRGCNRHLENGYLLQFIQRHALLGYSPFQRDSAISTALMKIARSASSTQSTQNYCSSFVKSLKGLGFEPCNTWYSTGNANNGMLASIKRVCQNEGAASAPPLGREHLLLMTNAKQRFRLIAWYMLGLRFTHAVRIQRVSFALIETTLESTLQDLTTYTQETEAEQKKDLEGGKKVTGDQGHDPFNCEIKSKQGQQRISKAEKLERIRGSKDRVFEVFESGDPGDDTTGSKQADSAEKTADKASSSGSRVGKTGEGSSEADNGGKEQEAGSNNNSSDSSNNRVLRRRTWALQVVVPSCKVSSMEGRSSVWVCSRLRRNCQNPVCLFHNTELSHELNEFLETDPKELLLGSEAEAKKMTIIGRFRPHAPHCGLVAAVNNVALTAMSNGYCPIMRSRLNILMGWVASSGMLESYTRIAPHQLWAPIPLGNIIPLLTRRPNDCSELLSTLSTSGASIINTPFHNRNHQNTSPFLAKIISLNKQTQPFLKGHSDNEYAIISMKELRLLTSLSIEHLRQQAKRECRVDQGNDEDEDREPKENRKGSVLREREDQRQEGRGGSTQGTAAGSIPGGNTKRCDDRATTVGGGGQDQARGGVSAGGGGGQGTGGEKARTETASSSKDEATWDYSGGGGWKSYSGGWDWNTNGWSNNRGSNKGDSDAAGQQENKGTPAVSTKHESAREDREGGDRAGKRRSRSRRRNRSRQTRVNSREAGRNMQNTRRGPPQAPTVGDMILAHTNTHPKAPQERRKVDYWGKPVNEPTKSPNDTNKSQRDVDLRSKGKTRSPPRKRSRGRSEKEPTERVLAFRGRSSRTPDRQKRHRSDAGRHTRAEQETGDQTPGQQLRRRKSPERSRSRRRNYVSRDGGERRAEQGTREDEARQAGDKRAAAEAAVAASVRATEHEIDRLSKIKKQRDLIANQLKKTAPHQDASLNSGLLSPRLTSKIADWDGSEAVACKLFDMLIAEMKNNTVAAKLTPRLKAQILSACLFACEYDREFKKIESYSINGVDEVMGKAMLLCGASEWKDQGDVIQMAERKAKTSYMATLAGTHWFNLGGDKMYKNKVEACGRHGALTHHHDMGNHQYAEYFRQLRADHDKGIEAVPLAQREYESKFQKSAQWLASDLTNPNKIGNAIESLLAIDSARCWMIEFRHNAVEDMRCQGPAGSRACQHVQDYATRNRVFAGH
jgi:hypothetical protein